jgi:epoxyqueuosine reductase
MAGVSPPPSVEELVALGRAHGLDAVGVASAEAFLDTRAHLEERKAAGLHGGMRFTYRRPEVATDPERALPGAASLVVGARSYLVEDPGVTEEDGNDGAGHDGPSGDIARYAWRDHYADLRAALDPIAERLRSGGWRARVLADDNALVDRAAAHRAGIGWFGKNANLLLPGRGSWYVLGAVLTTAPLAPAAGPVADGCGPCRRCLDGCPTGAIIEPGVVDARRCLAWILQDEGPFPRRYRAALGGRVYGCDDCQEVCPVNRRSSRPSGAGLAVRPRAPLLALLDPDDAVVLGWADRWYIPRREVRYVRRNALVALGNVGRGDDPAVGSVLEAHLRHPDPMLRAHAAWAAHRLGRADLLDLVTADDAPEVRDELAALAADV